MKKLYSAALLMSLSLVGFSQDQRVNNINLEKALSSPEHGNSRGVSAIESTNISERGNTFWSEDFGDGTNVDDVISTNNGDWTQEGPNGDIWKFSTSPSNGCWSGATALPTSSTVANGFLIFDADSASCINPNTDPPTFDGDAAFTGSIVSPEIDCSGQSAVALQFSHNYRWCCTDLFIQVEVSTDGGDTYSDIFELNAGAANVPVNEDIVINLSAIAPGEDDVKIKFTWSSLGNYFWALDDMFLFVPADNNLTVSNSYMGDIIDFWEYSQVPLTQAAGLDLGATITNNGGQVSDDAQLAIDVFFNGAMDPVYSEASNPAELIQGVDTLVWIYTDYVPDAIGDYSVNFTAQDTNEDADPEDNITEGSLEVTEFIYARDNNVVQGGFPNANFLEDDTPFSAGNLFEIVNDQIVYGIDFVLTNNTEEGAKVLVQLLDGSSANFDPLPDGVSDQVQIWEDNYSAIGDDDPTWITIAFDEGVAVTAESFVLPVVTYFGGDGGLQVGRSQTDEPDQTNFIFGPFGVDGVVNWYFSNTNYMVRLNFNPNAVTTVGEISPEVGFRLDQNVPNPVSSNSYITFELLEAGDVELVLMDITGKEVANLASGYKAVGTHRVDFNLGDLAPGVYNYSLLHNNQKLTKSLLVE